MAAQAASTRIAGEALEKFFGLGSKAVAGKLGLAGTALTLAEPAAQLVGAAGLRVGEALAAPSTEKKKEAQDFTRQPYTPGTLPLTNEQAGYAYLNEMKYQQQMQLLMARQNASSPYTQPENFAALDPMSVANQMFKTQEY